MNQHDPKPEATDSRKARARQKQAELRQQRETQLQNLEEAVQELQNLVIAAEAAERICDSLLSHSSGFYEVVDKLAKGKVLVEATPLVTQQANDIISDAKNIIRGDIHLDRIKKFVPAGNPPFYPDVLISIRAVRDSLDRWAKDRQSHLSTLNSKICKAKTAIGALDYFLDDDEDSGKDKSYPTKTSMHAYVQGPVWEPSFLNHRYGAYFNFADLDEQGVRAYLWMDEKDGAEMGLTTEPKRLTIGDNAVSPAPEGQNNDAETKE